MNKFHVRHSFVHEILEDKICIPRVNRTTTDANSIAKMVPLGPRSTERALSNSSAILFYFLIITFNPLKCAHYRRVSPKSVGFSKTDIAEATIWKQPGLYKRPGNNPGIERFSWWKDQNLAKIFTDTETYV